MRDKKYVVLYGCSEGMGLTYHLTDMAIALAAKMAPHPELEFHLVSTRGEQQSGQWDTIFRHIEQNRAHRFDDLAAISTFVESLLTKPEAQKVIVLTQGVGHLSTMLSLKRKYGNRLFLAIRLNSFRNGAWYRPLYTWGLSFLLAKYCDFVNFQSDYSADIFVNAKKIFNAGIGGTIPLGCSRPPLIVTEHRELRELFENEKLVKFIYLAQFYSHKNHLWIVDSLRDILAKNDNIRIVFLGDGILVDKIKARICRFQLEDKILCPGRIHRSFIPWILERADCALVASKAETFGHNYLEPMFFGTPVIGTDAGIGREIIKDFYTGFLIKNFSEKQLRNAVGFFIKHPERFKSFGENAQNLVHEVFSWEAVAQRYVDFIKNI